MLLVLLSGAGLLAFALVDLVDAVQTADHEAAAAARRRAERTAALVRARLDAPAILDAVPGACRFDLDGGRLVVPPEVGWLHEPPRPYTEADLPAEAWVHLSAARRAELVERDRGAASAAMDKALAVEAPDAGATFLLAAAGWQAQRFGDAALATARCKELLAREQLEPGVAASAVLLARALGLDGVAEEGARCRAALLPEAAAPEVVRLAGTGARRRVLADLDRHPEALRHGGRLGDAVVLLAGARGVVVDRAALVAALQAEGIDGVEALATSGGRDAVPVLGGLVVRPVVATPSFWADPAVLLVLLGLLVACFGSGLFLSFRALVRESAAMRARAEFLTSVTHELKTPLSSIRLLAEMLDEDRVRGEARRRGYYKLLAGESARLTVLIENVLDLGRMERGERAYDRRPQAPDDVVREAVAVFAPVASRDGMELDVDLAAGDRPGAVDRGALVQALLNVMENARKYANGRLELSSRVEGDRYRLALRDHGPGVPADMREAIFDRFRRGAQRSEVPGVGLGLYLARAILRAHAGELACVPPEGPGACFVMTLPLLEDAS